MHVFDIASVHVRGKDDSIHVGQHTHQKLCGCSFKYATTDIKTHSRNRLWPLVFSQFTYCVTVQSVHVTVTL